MARLFDERITPQRLPNQRSDVPTVVVKCMLIARRRTTATTMLCFSKRAVLSSRCDNRCTAVCRRMAWHSNLLAEVLREEQQRASSAAGV